MEVTSAGLVRSLDISEVGITEGLVAWYPLNGDAKDYTMNRNDGVVNGATVAPGIGGKLCYEFNYTTDRIETVLGSSGQASAVTLSTWMNSNDITKSQNIISRNGPYFLRIVSSKLRTALYTDSWDFGTGSAVLVSNTWYHLALTYDGARVKGYVNGEVDIDRSKIGDMVNFAGTTFIGYTSAIGENAPFDGKIQNVRIYNRALSAEEIAILYDLEKPGATQMQVTNSTIYIAGEFKET